MSILTTIKKVLGIDEAYTHFDQDIIMFINTAFLSLNQIGVGPANPFSITDNTKIWADFFGEREDLEAVKSYIFLKVKLMFDPPSNSFVLDSIDRQLTQIEWRLNHQVDEWIFSEPVEEEEGGL